MARHMNVKSQVGSCWLLDGRIREEPFQDMLEKMNDARSETNTESEGSNKQRQM